MSVSLQDAIHICREEYPDLYPYAYIEFEEGWIFNLLAKGVDPDNAIADMHMVMRDNGDITGSLPIMELMKDKGFRNAWQHATVLKRNEVEHSGFFPEATDFSIGGDGWSVRKSNSLSHHGIKGQQWGVSNGPPYPLEKKVSKAIKKGNNPAAQNDGELHGIPDEAKPFAVIGAAVATIVAHNFAIKVIGNTIKRIRQNKRTAQSKEINDALIGDIAEHKEYNNDSVPKRIVGEHSVEEDMYAVNPKYAGEAVPGTTNNCVLCAYTYDLRRRGYDVTAKPSIHGNYNEVLMADLYEGGREERIRGRDWVDIYDKAAKKYPEGARGVLGAQGIFGGGHAMAWEIRNGKLEIIDGQRNVKSSPEELQSCLYRHDPQFIRTDNLKVREKNISKVCSELKDDWKSTVRSINRNKVVNPKPRNGYMTEDDIRSSSNKSKKRPMTRAEKRESLERVWKEEHRNTYMDDSTRESMKKWVDANMWSMYGHEGQVLVHYGIKGQQWGVRRFQNEDRTLTPAGKERYGSRNSENDHRNEHKTGTNRDGEPVKTEKTNSSKWKSGDVKDLSDEELNRRNNRLQREKQYVDLTTPQWKKNAKQTASDVLKKIFLFSAVPIAALAMQKHYQKVADVISKFATQKIASIKAAKILGDEVNRRSYFDMPQNPHNGKYVGHL